ncbi:MAG: preprotein translocase subunit SecE [Candidatus Acidiferrales bacterium]
MAQATKLSNGETRGEGSSFSVPGPIARIAEYPGRMRQFLHDVRVEMRQVNWPSRQDVWSTTIVVIVTVAFFGVFFFLVDGGVGYLIQRVLKYFK